MIMVTGGIASGKKTFLESAGVDLTRVFEACDGAASAVSFEDATVVLHVEELVRQSALDDATFHLLFEKQAITANEVGNGVIPLTWEERQFRERAGSLSSALAEKSDCVIRMVCGIPIVLKGSMPKGE